MLLWILQRAESLIRIPHRAERNTRYNPTKMIWSAGAQSSDVISAHRPIVHFVCNNGCNLFHTVSAMIFCPAAVGWI